MRFPLLTTAGWRLAACTLALPAALASAAENAPAGRAGSAITAGSGASVAAALATAAENAPAGRTGSAITAGSGASIAAALATPAENALAGRTGSAAVGGSGASTAAAPAGSTGQTITRAGAQASVPGSADFFTGRSRYDPKWTANADINTSGGYVTFEPGARSAWHTHPAGQYLIVTAGVGRTQEEGKPMQEIRAGDVVWCPPGVRHWHGAAPTTGMTHIAVTGTRDGKNVNWMEKVSDAQYHGH